jgi:hypothetical protein
MKAIKSDINSLRFRERLGLALPAVYDVTHKLYGHPLFSEIYPEYLFRLHCIIRASVPLMECALQRASLQKDEDPLSAMLVAYFSKHIPEENSHDDWLLEDLELLGMERSQTLARCPPPTIAAMVGMQYYWVLHYHPAMLLGYIGVLEGAPPSVNQIEHLRQETGLPSDAFRSLLKHSKLDPIHKQEFDLFLDEAPLTSDLFTCISINAFHTVRFTVEVIDELIDAETKDLERYSSTTIAQGAVSRA